MREITKALGSFSMAMSAFGAQQVLNLARRPIPGAGHPASAELDAVSQAASQQLGGYLQHVFEAGDRVQRSTVDLAYGVLSGEALHPSRLVALSSDLVRQSAKAMRQMVPGVPAAGGPCGCGPKPPVS